MFEHCPTVPLRWRRNRRPPCFVAASMLANSQHVFLSTGSKIFWKRFRFRFRVSSLTNVRLACLLVSKESNALEFRFTPRRAVSDHPASRTRAVHLGSCAALCPFIAASREGFWLFAPPLDLLCGFFFLMPPARPPHVLSLPATFASSSSLCARTALSLSSLPALSLVSLPSALSPCSMLLAPSSLLLVEMYSG